MQCKQYIARNMLLPLMLLRFKWVYEEVQTFASLYVIEWEESKGAHMYRRRPYFSKAMKYNFSQMEMHVIHDT